MNVNNNSKKNVLYVGSSNSATLVKELNLNDYDVICVNNAWRLFNNTNNITWLHSGDFPRENYPPDNSFLQEISYKDYSRTAEIVAERLGWKTNSPQHYLGYTIFFLGLYWIMIEKQPEKICLLGFDHDYNKEKVKKWNDDQRPNIQNNFNKKTEKTIKEWSENYFKGLQPDFFYGHGTPDPLRLGEKHLLEKFNLAIEASNKLNIELVNYSPVQSEINIIKKEQLPCITIN